MTIWKPNSDPLLISCSTFWLNNSLESYSHKPFLIFVIFSHSGWSLLVVTRIQVSPEKQNFCNSLGFWELWMKSSWLSFDCPCLSHDFTFLIHTHYIISCLPCFLFLAWVLNQRPERWRVLRTILDVPTPAIFARRSTMLLGSAGATSCWPRGSMLLLLPTSSPTLRP